MKELFLFCLTLSPPEHFQKAPEHCDHRDHRHDHDRVHDHDLLAVDVVLEQVVDVVLVEVVAVDAVGVAPAVVVVGILVDVAEVAVVDTAVVVDIEDYLAVVVGIADFVAENLIFIHLCCLEIHVCKTHVMLRIDSWCHPLGNSYSY